MKIIMVKYFLKEDSSDDDIRKFLMGDEKKIENYYLVETV
jgi:hypothetical protein